MEDHGVYVLLAQAGELPGEFALASTQDGHRICCASSGVIPPLQCCDTKANIEPGIGMTPGLGGKLFEGAHQPTWLRR
jgi:hypothetical protein